MNYKIKQNLTDMENNIEGLRPCVSDFILVCPF